MNILENHKNFVNRTYLTISVLGKNLNLGVKYRNNPIIELDKQEQNINLYLPKKYRTMDNVNIINMAIEKMYDEIAETEIENSMEKIRVILGFAPEDYKIERMKESFCKVKNKVLVINPDIVKYNKKIIETTLLQAFCKSQYKVNSKAYKQALEAGIEKYEKMKYQLIINRKTVRNIAKVS